jgi:DNA helicase-2/ATP-dependent DNA helicase PcrA
VAVADRVEERLAQLNDPQREAVLHADGPLLILAGAGSGKTRVLAYRIAHLVDAVGVRPSEILAITFTNKAADEMRERVESLVGGAVRGMWVMTFHAACARMLRREAERIGFTRQFTIYDSGDQRRLMKRVLEDLGVDQKRTPPQAILNRVSDAKNRLQRAGDLRARDPGDRFLSLVARAFAQYEERLRAANAMDFDDLLVRAVDLFRQYPEVRERYGRTFRYVMVDEYQDTNHAQYELLRLLCADHGNLAVVGDDFQSVYSFRGADITNILRFEDDFPDARVVKLEQNYRSTQRILDTANGVIEAISRRTEKKLFTHLGDGERVRVVELEDEHAEATFVAREIDRLGDTEGVPRAECAIFYRTNAQSRVVEDTLRRAGIDYQVVGGTRFYDRAEIRDAMAYLQLIGNPEDAISFARAVGAPRRGIGDTTVARILAHAEGSGDGLGFTLDDPSVVPGLAGAAVARVRAFGQDIRRWREAANTGTAVGELLDRILTESGTRDALRAERSIEAEGRLENLEELVGFARTFDAERVAQGEEGGLGPFLEQTALRGEADDLRTDTGRPPQVSLMTLHNAKGLEFDAVFVLGVEETLLPHQRSMEAGVDAMDEERRLLYVGITRARRHCVLTFTQRRTLFGESSPRLPSSFLADLPEESVLRHETRRPRVSATTWARPGSVRAGGGARPGAAAAAAAAGDAAMSRFRPGTDVVHPAFGEGVVLSVSADRSIRVRFAADGSERQLMVDYAPLTVR